MTSQEIQAALTVQTAEIGEKREYVMEDLAKVEPAVQDAQAGMTPRLLWEPWLKLRNHQPGPIS